MDLELPPGGHPIKKPNTQTCGCLVVQIVADAARREPGQCSTSDPSGGQVVQEQRVGDGVEICAEIKMYGAVTTSHGRR